MKNSAIYQNETDVRPTKRPSAQTLRSSQGRRYRERETCFWPVSQWFGPTVESRRVMDGKRLASNIKCANSPPVDLERIIALR